jgi:hypothetical protein
VMTGLTVGHADEFHTVSVTTEQCRRSAGHDVAVIGMCPDDEYSKWVMHEFVSRSA